MHRDRLSAFVVLAMTPAALADAPLLHGAARDVIVSEAIDGTLAPLVIEPGADGRPGVALAAADDATASPWHSHFDLGVAGSFGNTDTQDVHVGVGSSRETESDRTALDVHYYLGISDGDRTRNKLTAGALQDWLVPDSPWLYFVDVRYDYDEFQSWEHRVGAHGGVGYHLVEEEDFDLVLRGGLGFSKEFGSEDEPFIWEGFLGFDLGWQITEKQRLEVSSTWFPRLEDPAEFRLVSSADWSLLVDEEAGMNLTAGIRHEHQTDVDPGIEHNDWNVYAGLSFDF